MSLLNAVEENVATGVVKEVYDEVKTMFGSVPEGLKLWSLNPETLQHHWEEIKKNLAKDVETQKFDTILRYLVSEIEGCEFCVGFNAGLLLNMFGMTQDELATMTKEPKMAPLGEKQTALLLFALKVVRQSKEVNVEDIEHLKAFDITEKEIFDVAYLATNLLVSDMLLNAFKV
jgi:alkylhydroperoxidase family enzyme